MKAQSNSTNRSALNPQPPLNKTGYGTQFVVILDAAGRPVALAPMAQLENTAIPAERIRIVRDRRELVEIWK